MPLIIREECAFADTLEIVTVVERINSGRRVIGRLKDFEFEALVFAGHAPNSTWELGWSRIRELVVLHGGEVQFRWCSGSSRPTCDQQTADAITIIAAYLADRVFPRFD